MMKDAQPDDLMQLAAGPNGLVFDPALGAVRAVTLHDHGRTIAPLHSAHWVGTDVPAGMAPVEKSLSGDFFCAPFAISEDPDVPPHGFSANSPWAVTISGSTWRAELDERVQGATLTKTLTLSADAPHLMQEHIIEGGAGALTVAHHPMVKLAGRGRFSTSSKRAALTPHTPLEPRHMLRYPAHAARLTDFPGRDGPVDLTRLAGPA